MSDPTQTVGRTPLDEVARRLAAQHLLTTEPGMQPHLLLCFKQYDIAIQRIYQEWAEASEQEQLLPSSADWLLDNYYIVRPKTHRKAATFPRHQGHYQRASPIDRCGARDKVIL